MFSSFVKRWVHVYDSFNKDEFFAYRVIFFLFLNFLWYSAIFGGTSHLKVFYYKVTSPDSPYKYVFMCTNDTKHLYDIFRRIISYVEFTELIQILFIVSMVFVIIDIILTILLSKIIYNKFYIFLKFLLYLLFICANFAVHNFFELYIPVENPSYVFWDWYMRHHDTPEIDDVIEQFDVRKRK